ncbi:hypothetical protein QTP70_028399 [Hemibagrus guttatus]|uniref:PDZ and LIM domain protein 2 n=1 Tax=Hemibagrus guttatus TaxID=175788 RepID=A0AAE0R2Q5_9TELE|nr:hypothetical protein QTP70_028399 [Hemibagrus guttatus]
MAFTVNLTGPSPWGFRISGGRDFKKAITVSKVNPGSKAEKASLQPGDVILEINGENTGDMLNVEAQNKIKSSKTQLQLLVERPPPSSPGQTNGINSTEQLVGRFQTLPPALPEGSQGVPRETSRRHPRQMPEPPQLSTFDVEEQRLYFELLPGGRDPYPRDSLARVWVVGAPAHDCYPKHTAPDPYAPSCGCWAYGKETLHVRDENQNYREYSISSPTSFSPGPYSPEPPSSPGRKGGRITPTMKSPVFHSWSYEEKISSHRLSRPLSQEISTVEFRSNSVSSRTPTPPERYSPHSPIEREAPMSPRRNSSDFAMQRFDRESEVYKMIQENKESRAAPRQSSTFKMLQEVLEADEKEAALMFPGKLSPTPAKPVTSVAGVQKYHTCEKCGNNIVTQAVRIIDGRFRHPDCYTCADCGLNLKMRGHFWVEDELFCEKHARQRYQGPGAGYRHPISPHH